VILDATTPPLGTVTVRRDLIVPFDETFFASQDLEWWLRQTQVCRVATVPSFAYMVRKHPGAREGYGTEARIEHSLRLLERYRDYFDRHPRARAFRWKRIGLMRLSLGDRAGARAAFLRSLGADPSLRTAWHFLRACGPSGRLRGEGAVPTADSRGPLADPEGRGT